MSDSYVVIPPNPKVNVAGTFDLVYTTNSIPFADNATYDLVNTDTNTTVNSIMATGNVYSFTTQYTPAVYTIFSLSNYNIFTDLNESSTYNVIYDESGTVLSTNTTDSDTANTFGMTTDGSYIYGFTAGNKMNKYNLDGSYISGATLNVGYWFLGSDYCPTDGFIYSVQNGSGNVHKINRSTGESSLVVSIAGQSFGGVAFNADYTYMYCSNRSNGNIYYIERANPSNRGILVIMPTTPTAVTTFGITCNRSVNMLYMCSPDTSKIYYVLLFSGTNSTQPNQLFTMTAASYAIHYSNINNRVLIAGTDQKIYTLKANPLSFTGISNNTLTLGTNNLQIKRNSVNFGDLITINATCFLEGTRLLCLIDDKEEYVEIEKIRKGTLVKTHFHGFKAVHSIGKGEIFNPSEKTETVDRLYVLSKNDCDELIDDLYMTGHHSVLVPIITDEQREQIIKCMDKVYITDDKYRLPAYLDERFKPCVEHGTKTIWHLALENENIYENYGVFANGLLVETCSIRYLTQLSKLELQE